MEIKQAKLNYLGVNNEIKAGTKKFFEKNENNDTIYRNFCNTAKVMLEEKFIALNAYIKKFNKTSV